MTTFLNRIESVGQNIRTLSANGNLVIATLLRGHVARNSRELIYFSNYWPVSFSIKLNKSLVKKNSPQRVLSRSLNFVYNFYDQLIAHQHKMLVSAVQYVIQAPQLKLGVVHIYTNPLYPSTCLWGVPYLYPWRHLTPLLTQDGWRSVISNCWRLLAELRLEGGDRKREKQQADYCFWAQLCGVRVSIWFLSAGKKQKNLCLGVCDQIGKTGSDSSKGGGGQSAVAFPRDCDTARVCLSIFSQGSSVTTRPLRVRHLHPVLPHRSSSRRPAASPQSRTMSTDCLSVSKHFD